MRYLFWNTNNKKTDEYIYKMIIEYKPSIISLAEYNGDFEKIAKDIYHITKIEYIVLPTVGCKINILIKKNLESKVQHCKSHPNFTIKIIPYNSYHEEHIVVFVHLPSKLHCDNNEKNRRLLENITNEINLINQSKDRKVVILGDFNLNPYDSAMIYLTGCNAISSKHIVKKIFRLDRKDSTQFFYYYNPMWNFLGDNSEPCGTYYYNSTSDHSQFWNTFDQFVVSPELIKDIQEIKIIKEVDNQNLGDKNGIPKVSDHYPLYFKLGGS